MQGRTYLCLDQQEYSLGDYRLVPIRDQDKYLIMQWRNEQIYHLRQSEPLTPEMQEKYFSEVIPAFFLQNRPSNLLFSYLKQDQCIGYGGLVHINWKDRHAEISFIMSTELEQEQFNLHWGNYLTMLKQVAGSGLGFRKMYTYAFDLRPQLYKAVEQSGFVQEARLKDHCFFENRFVDVVIHSYFFTV